MNHGKNKTENMKKLNKSYTHHIKTDCILCRTKKNNDRKHNHIKDISFEPTGTIQQAIKEQNAIGWNNFYQCRVSLKWLTAQQEQYKKQ
jgi:hypothetical protein